MTGRCMMGRLLKGSGRKRMLVVALATALVFLGECAWACRLHYDLAALLQKAMYSF